MKSNYLFPGHVPKQFKIELIQFINKHGGAIGGSGALNFYTSNSFETDHRNVKDIDITFDLNLISNHQEFSSSAFRNTQLASLIRDIKSKSSDFNRIRLSNLDIKRELHKEVAQLIKAEIPQISSIRPGNRRYEYSYGADRKNSLRLSYRIYFPGSEDMFTQHTKTVDLCIFIQLTPDEEQFSPKLFYCKFDDIDAYLMPLTYILQIKQYYGFINSKQFKKHIMDVGYMIYNHKEQIISFINRVNELNYAERYSDDHELLSTIGILLQSDNSMDNKYPCLRCIVK